MSRYDLPFTDAELHAFIDGELDEARRLAISEMLVEDEQLRQKLAQYRMINSGLRTLAKADESEPVPQRLLQAAVAGKKTGRYSPMKAALLLILGGAGGFFASTSLQLADMTPHEPDRIIDTQLIHPAALAHATYTPESRHPVEVSASQEQHLVEWLSNRLDRRLRIPQLNEAGYSLVGGRLLPAAEQGAAQFMYEKSDGSRLTLYVRKLEPKEDNAAFSMTTADGVSVFYWVADDYGFALSGDLSRERLLTIGKLAYRQLDH